MLLDESDVFRLETLGLLQQLGIGSIDSARNVGADVQLGRKRRPKVAAVRLRAAGLRARRVGTLRKAGASTQNLTISGSSAAVIWGSASEGFHADAARSARIDAVFRLSRAQHAKITMLAHSQTGKTIDPSFHAPQSSHHGLGRSSVGELREDAGAAGGFARSSAEAGDA